MSDLSKIIAGLTPEQRELLLRRLRKPRAAAEEGAKAPASPSIPWQPRGPEGLPLSFAQQRLWLLDQLIPGNPAYNMPASVRLSGPLDVASLVRTLESLARRHETLRTTFHVVVDGEPRQRIAAEPSVSLPCVDLGGLPPANAGEEARRLTDGEAYRPFDLTVGPLLRSLLLRLGRESHLLVLTIHHIVSDGWSVGILQRELAAFYEAFAGRRVPGLGELTVQYGDFAVWQRDWLEGGVLEAQLPYWRRQLQSPPNLTLPTDHPRPAGPLVRGAARTGLLPRALAERLEGWAREEAATPFMVLLAGFGALLSRYSGQTDLVVGSPIANRRSHETEKLIGFFVNTLALRLDLSGEPSAHQLLRRVRKVALDAYVHQDVPFEKVVEQVLAGRHLGINPLFQVMFALQNAPQTVAEVSGLRIETLEVDARTAQFDMTWSLSQASDGLQVQVTYSSDLFDSATVLRMLEHFGTLLGAMAGDPRERVADLPLMTPAERHQALAEWAGQWEPAPDQPCLHEVFEAQAERTPEAVAVTLDGEGLTYRELNLRANRLAWRLIDLGVDPGTLVGLFTTRSLDMVVAILGILKAGGAYVPLDPAYPRERLAWILEDARAPVVLTEASLLAELPDLPGTEVVCLDAPPPSGDAVSAGNPLRRAAPDSPAYVIFTSGSTGRPKGVVVLHGNAVSLMEADLGGLPLRSGRRGDPVPLPGL